MTLPIDDSLTLNDADFLALTDVNAVAVTDAQEDAQERRRLFGLLVALLALTSDGSRVNLETGQTVTEDTILAAYDTRTGEAIRQLQRLAQGLLNGNGSLDDLTAAGLRELRNAHIQAYALGRGGLPTLDPADYRIIRARLRTEGGFWRDFMRALGEGEISEAEMQRRFDLYARGTRTTFFDGLNVNAADVGFTEEARVLGPTDHCNPCVDLSNLGFQPIGTLPSPGTVCEGGHNCGCGKIYR